jgi:hypothetical protein
MNFVREKLCSIIASPQACCLSSPALAQVTPDAGAKVAPIPLPFRSIKIKSFW